MNTRSFRKKRENRRKAITNEIMVPELKDMNLQVERAHTVPSKMDGERSTQTMPW